MNLNREDVKFLKGLVGKKVGFTMGSRPVGAVDEKQMVLHDVAVCIQGEALGHGVWLDDKFIRDVVEQGNAAEKGLLCHFGHEDSNAGRIKNYMGVFSNFCEKPAKDHAGEDCIGAYADIKFSKVANEKGDNVSWVMGLARERPDALGLSIVFSVADYKIKTADGGELLWSEFIEGKEIRTWEEYYAAIDEYFAQSVDGKLYVVMGKLYGADFVAEGAATDGLFAHGDADADDPAAALIGKLAKLAAGVPADGAESAQAEGTADKGDGSSPTESAPGSAQAEHDESAAEASDGNGQQETPAESTDTQEASEAQENSEGLSSGGDDTKTPPGMEEALAKMKAECDKRIAGFQSMHDKKLSELNGQIKSLQAELTSAKDEASAAKKKLEAKVTELAQMRERLTSLETAHNKLTAGALTIGDGAHGAKTMAEFVKDHGGDFSRAVREDPETYKRICAANGWKPAALGR